jgi:hypothetical protein
MMKKKYIIILFIAMVGAVGFFIYRNQKQTENLKSHHNHQYNRMIEMAQKSSIAGLVHMGKALNNYKEKNGAYPTGLSALYPDFIPVKAFVDDIQWHYKPSGKVFFLSKTIKKRGGKVMTASIGPDLMPQDGSAFMVASIETQTQKSAGPETKPIKKTSKTGDAMASAKRSKPMVKTLAPNMPSTGLKNSRSKLNDSTKPVVSKKRTMPDLEEVSTHKLTEKEEFIHRIQQEFLVWRNADGSLGFSNIQYPASKDLTVYYRGEWIPIRPNNLYARTQKDVR